MSKPQVFTMKLKPKDGTEGKDETEYALNNDEIFIGWGNLTFSSTPNKNEILEKYEDAKCPQNERGDAVGYIYRFYNEIKIGDLAITNYNGKKYAGVITSEAYHSKENDDICHRHSRKIDWLNDKNPIYIDNYKNRSTLERKSDAEYYIYCLNKYLLSYAEESKDFFPALKNARTKDFYMQLYLKNLEVGEEGELWVLEQLSSKYPRAQIDHVSRIDGRAGFDILLRLHDNSCQLIEVKTTKCNLDTPFFMSANEICKMKDNEINYVIYRVYNFGSNNVNVKEIRPGEISVPDITHEAPGTKAHPISYRIGEKRNNKRVFTGK